MPKGAPISEEGIRTLRRDHRRLLQQVANLRKQLRQNYRPVNNTASLVIVCKADSPIPALSGSTPGSGTVSVWIKRAGAWVDSGRNETAYNFSAATVTAGVFLHCKRHSQSGDLLVDFESCS